MSVDPDGYRTEFIHAAPALSEVLDNLFAEGARTLSPAGMKEWLEGARALLRLNRSPELLRAHLENMPAVARECGEDVIPDVIAAVMQLASLTSGAVIALVFASLPTAARRMGDAELLRGYLRLLHRLAAKAPRGLRPMLGRLDELLGKLTLSGLTRWVDFGAEAYRRDFAGQAAYFGLQTEDSRAVLQRERRGTLFVDIERKLNLYLRAFWARDFLLRPAAAEDAAFRPYVEGGAMHLPDAVDDLPGGVGGLDLYRAMAAHAAAHLVYRRNAVSDKALSPAQMFFVGFFEDARVEHCAIRAFPGLRRLWRSLHCAAAPETAGHETLALLERASLALLDAAESSGDDEVDEMVRRFRDHLDAHCDDETCSLAFGLELFSLLDRRRNVPSLRVLERLRIPYRDDNRLLWRGTELAWFDEAAWLPAGPRQVRKRVSMMEFVNALDVETAGDDAQEVWVLDGVLYDDDGSTWNAREGREPVSEPHRYPEWDYRVPLLRPDWTTVFERRAQRGDPEAIDRILLEHKPIASRIRRIVDRLRPQGIIRQRKLEDGDELDLNAAVDAVVALRAGLPPDMRITMRNQIHSRDLAMLVLLDLSESTNDVVRGSTMTKLDLTREACALVATAVAGVGDPFAIHGFSSDGRHDVQYLRFKDFDQRFDADCKSRLAGMKGGLSTRMGAAMRHAGAHLARQPARRKLLLVVTDGEPADIDERDPHTLRHDARKAVEHLHTRGVDSYCLTLDPNADSYVERIFGTGRYMILDRVQRLPEQLLALFANLTR